MTCVDCLTKGLPKQGNLLVNVRRILQSMNHKFTEQLRDNTGRIYAFKMQAESGLPFILIVKGSEIMNGIVSTQKSLLESWHGPLVLAIQRKMDEAPHFHVFHPDEILQHKIFVNKRFGVDMVNYRLNLSIQWTEGESLDAVWLKLKNRQSAVLTTFMETTA